MQPLLPQVVIQPGEKPGQAPNTMSPSRHQAPVRLARRTGE